MEFLQLIYTSCPRGQGQGAGFQIYSYSEGLTEEEVAEIEGLCTYIPPRDLPSQPTVEEIELHFPTSFSYKILRSGRISLSSTVYLGQDYSGRYGNYFTHVLVLTDGLLPIHPISFYQSPIFRKSLTKEELNIVSTPDPLPRIKIRREGLGQYIREFDVSSFLQENKREQGLKQMINHLIERKGAEDSLLIIDQYENIPLWIASIQQFLPLSISQGISFTSYMDFPLDKGFVLGGKKESVQIPTQSKIAIFDFQMETFPEEIYPSDYTSYIFNGEINLKQLTKLFSYLQIHTIDERINDALYLTPFMKGARSSFSQSKLQRGLRLLSKQTLSRDAYIDLHRNFSTNRFLALCQEHKNIKLVLQFYIKAIDKTRDEKILIEANSFLLEKLIDFILDGICPKDINKLLQGIKGSPVFYEAMLDGLNDKDYLNQLSRTLLEVNSIQHNQFYLLLLLKALKERDKSIIELKDPLIEEIATRIITQKSIKKTFLLELLKFPKDFTQIMVNTFNRLVLKEERQRVIEAYKTALASLKDVNERNRIKNLLHETAFSEKFQRDLVYYEFKNMDELIYLDSHMKSFTQLLRRQKLEIIARFIKKLKQEERNITKELTILIKNSSLYELVYDQRDFISLLVNNQKYINFNQLDEKSHRKDYELLAQVTNENSIYFLIAETLQEEEKQDRDTSFLLERIVNYISDKQYFCPEALRGYIEWGLPTLVNSPYDESLMDQIIQKKPGVILTALIKNLQAIDQGKWASLFVKSFSLVSFTDLNGELKEEIIQLLVNEASLYKSIQELFEQRDEEVSVWLQFEEEINNRRKKSPFHFMKRLFKR